MGDIDIKVKEITEDYVRYLVKCNQPVFDKAYIDALTGGYGIIWVDDDGNVHYVSPEDFNATEQENGK